MVDEGRQLAGQCRSRDGESVNSARVLPVDHVSGELLGCADEMHLPRATSNPLRDLAQRGIRVCACGSEQLFRATGHRGLAGP